MNNYENSLYGSSVRSYKNIQQPRNGMMNIVKYLHTHDRLDQQLKQQMNPLLIRNKSYDVFNSKIFDKPSRDKNIKSNKFYQSIVNSSTQQKYINQINNLQNQITKLMANQLSLKTQKDLLIKQNKRFKEQILYLNQKCKGLEQKNQELFKNQSRMIILQRQYNKILVEHEQFKNNCMLLHEQYPSDHITNLPTKIEHYYPSQQQKSSPDYFRLKNESSSNRFNGSKFSGKINQKVSWKKTTQGGISPIYKLDGYRKYSGGRLQQVSLIESKIDKQREQIPDDRQLQNMRMRQQMNTKTIDLKDLQRIKEYDSKFRILQLQIKQLRNKNINLYKKYDEIQNQKLILLENNNELNYQKTKILSDLKYKQNQFKKQLEKIKLELESNKIKIIQLNQIIISKDEDIKLIIIEKNQIMDRFNNIAAKDGVKQNQIIAQLKLTMQKSEKQLANLKQRWGLLNKKQQQLQIENKLYLRELQQKNEMIIRYKQQLQEGKKMGVISENDILQSLSKTDKIRNDEAMVSKQIKQDGQVQTQINCINFNEEVIRLRDMHQKLLNEHNIWGFELNKLKNQNIFLNDNYLKLSKLYQQQKIENKKLKQLNIEWREIEKRTREMKKLDDAVDHLWQIKQVQYQNIHFILSKIKKSS